MITILLGSRTRRPPTGSCHCPAASRTVSPSGKRGVISRARNRDHAAASTRRWPAILRPNINSICCMGRCGALQATAGALAKMLMAAKLPISTWQRPAQRKSTRKLRVIAASGQRLADLLGHLLGVAEQHHGVVAIEQRIVDAGISRRERALAEHDGAGLPYLQHRHAVDRGLGVILGGGVGDAVGADRIATADLRQCQVVFS